MKHRIAFLMAAAPLLAAACGESSDVTAPPASAALLATNPTDASTLGEQIVVCKVGGEGSYDFSWSGTDHRTNTPISGSFSLQPDQCWQVGEWGGLGATISVTEAARTGHEVVSIAVDQRVSADQNLTGTNTASGVVATGSPSLDGALVTFTNRVLPPPELEGCTPGYWKNHPASWPATGYSPSQLFSSVFTGATTLSSSLTLNGALGLGGGSGIAGGEKILARAAVAALLNAASPGVSYALTTAEVIAQVNAALASQDRDTMLILASTLDGYNNYGCPLN